MNDVEVRAHAAVALVHARADGGSVLLTRRVEDARDHWSGHWCLPGGRREPADADLVATALRELREECGVTLSAAQVERVLPPGRAGGESRYVLVVPVILEVEAPLPLRRCERETAEARWLPLEELRDRSRHALRAVPGQPPDRLVPSFDLPPVPLWGFTYRVLCDWAGVGDAGSTSG